MKEGIGLERTAKVAFLSSLTVVVREALPAICSLVPKAARGPSAEYGKKVDEHFSWRGVLVAGVERPEPPDRRAAFEVLEGKGLYLSEGGIFVGVRFVGQLSRGSSYFWEAREVQLSFEEVVGSRWPVAEIAKSLAEELEIQAIGKEKATDRAARMTALVREAAKILEGVR